ncbi:MAG TPA: hypothetical protein VM532_08730, partial [Burkholderiales bacterium]|nr:hypothetical protein [Burkholderiales bacterium]
MKKTDQEQPFDEFQSVFERFQQTVESDRLNPAMKREYVKGGLDFLNETITTMALNQGREEQEERNALSAEKAVEGRKVKLEAQKKELEQEKSHWEAVRKSEEKQAPAEDVRVKGNKNRKIWWRRLWSRITRSTNKQPESVSATRNNPLLLAPPANFEKGSLHALPSYNGSQIKQGEQDLVSARQALERAQQEHLQKAKLQKAQQELTRIEQEWLDVQGKLVKVQEELLQARQRVSIAHEKSSKVVPATELIEVWNVPVFSRNFN